MVEGALALSLLRGRKLFILKPMVVFWKNGNLNMLFNQGREITEHNEFGCTNLFGYKLMKFIFLLASLLYSEDCHSDG